MTIRWGVSPIAWSNDDLAELGGDTTLDTILADARDIGFQGVELGNKFPRDARQLAPILDDYGLALVGGWYSSSLLLRDADIEIAAMADHLALLDAMGSDVFILAESSNAVHGDRHGGRLDSPPRLAAANWAEFGRRLNAVAAHVNGRGLRFAYHHHLGTVVERPEDMDRFLGATGNHVGFVLDTGHALCGGNDPVQLARTCPERINHVHCKDVRTDRFRSASAKGRSFLDGVIDGMFTAPGDGDYDYAPFMRTLSEIGYHGWIVVEAEQDPAVADPRIYSQTGLNTLKRLAVEAGLVS